MTKVNGAVVEAAYLKQAAVGGTLAIMATLGGDMVKGYDGQLTTYNAELLGINADKNQAMQDRNAVTTMTAKGEDAKGNSLNVTVKTDQEGIISKQGTVDVSGVIIDKTEKKALDDIAKEYGVDISKVQKYQGGYFISDKIAESLDQAIDTKITNLNSSSELKMINFQSLMDARKQAMMMLSNMLSADNQSKMSIIQNMKG